ncbi:MAG: hypothetical protein LBN08_01650 [Lactobacillales bacterium]|jgi:hypothetical protein|nr:hypothetical protein [Lactobacillales bacterium]
MNCYVSKDLIDIAKEIMELIIPVITAIIGLAGVFWQVNRTLENAKKLKCFDVVNEMILKLVEIDIELDSNATYIFRKDVPLTIAECLKKSYAVLDKDETEKIKALLDKANEIHRKYTEGLFVANLEDYVNGTSNTIAFHIKALKEVKDDLIYNEIRSDIKQIIKNLELVIK